MKEFAKHKHYHGLFISCNVPLDDGTRWCANCAKCCFVFLLFSAFLKPRKVWSIFGDNLFERRQLFGTFEELMGAKGKMKPLDCVGTVEEVLFCLHRAKAMYEEHEDHLPAFLQAVASDEAQCEKMRNSFGMVAEESVNTIDWKQNSLIPSWCHHVVLENEIKHQG